MASRIRVYFYERQGETKVERAYKVIGDFDAIKALIKELGGRYVSESKSWSISRKMFDVISSKFQTEHAITWQRIASDSESLVKAAHKPIEIDEW